MTIPRLLERHPALRWLGLFAAWSLFGLAVTNQALMADRVTGESRDTRTLVIAMMTSSWFWALLTPLLFAGFSRIEAARPGWGRRILLYPLAFLAVQTVDTLFDFGRAHLLLRGEATLAQVFFLQLVFNAFLFAILVTVWHAWRFQQRYEERRLRAVRLEGDLLRAELTALRTQLHPHFLFNTLNGIAEMVHRDPEIADSMTTNLGALLRAALESADEPETTLCRELEMLGLYLAIQRVRLGDRLLVTIDVPEDAGDARVPSLILQPLVENAIKHGYSPVTQLTRVMISARRAGDELHLSVEDGGPGPAGRSTGATGKGIGLRNVSALLNRLYGDGHRFALGPREGGGARVALVIPQVAGGAAGRFVSTV